jgi:hypothetical protein
MQFMAIVEPALRSIPHLAPMISVEGQAKEQVSN